MVAYNKIKNWQVLQLFFPKALEPGDCVGLVAPASPITKEERVKCVRALETLGYSAVPGATLFQEACPHGFSGADARARAQEVNEMFANPSVAAIFCVRGGYGSAELLEYLDYEKIAENPKIFMGYSDITSMHIALEKYSGLVTFHGPMVKSDLMQLAEENTEKKEEEKIKYMLESMRTTYRIPEEKHAVFQNPVGEAVEVLLEGDKSPRVVTGRLFGGNGAVLARLLGTRFSPVGCGEILFLEDVGESIPRIHMYLTQMKYAGLFQGVRGILLGDFTDCTNGAYDGSLCIKQFLKEWFRQLKIPVLWNVYSDHRGKPGTLPLGAMCSVHVKKKSIRFFSCV